MSERVFIFDTTLRDGEQSPGCSMTVPEKVRMARKLVELGADILEAGFPIASEGDFEAVQAVSREFPEARALFAVNVASFERAWYGAHSVTAEDTDVFRQRLRQIKAAMAPAEMAA